MSCELPNSNLPQFRFRLNNPKIMDIGISGADFKTNIANNLVNDFVIYLNNNLNKFINCQILSSLTELSSIDLSLFDNLIAQLNTKISNGDYNEIIINFANQFNQIQNEDSITQFISNLNNILSNILNNFRLPSNLKLILAILIAFLLVIFLLLIYIAFIK